MCIYSYIHIYTEYIPACMCMYIYIYLYLEPYSALPLKSPRGPHPQPPQIGVLALPEDLCLKDVAGRMRQGLVLKVEILP